MYKAYTATQLTRHINGLVLLKELSGHSIQCIKQTLLDTNTNPIYIKVQP